MNRLFPWQDALWLQHMPAAAQRHHALLLRGPRGVGKRRFAEVIGQSLLCMAPAASALPCGACQACGWIAQAQHPDFLLIEPRIDADAEGEGASTAKKAPAQVKVDQIREAVGKLALSTHQGGRRVVLIDPAEGMNAHAANALLKTLEEPPAGTLFLLVNHQRGALQATIVSRCRALDLAIPAPAQALAWLHQQGVAEESARPALALAGGAPLLALEKAAPEARARLQALLSILQLGSSMDPIAQAERLAQYGAAEILEGMQTWSHDLTARKLGQAISYHVDCADSLARTAAGARIEDLLALQRKLLDAKRLAGHPLNTRLVAEDLLLAYRCACGG
jgi:DNA polymerase-3 subunit delta'